MLRTLIIAILTLSAMSITAQTTDDGLPIIDIVFNGTTASVSIPAEAPDVWLNSQAGSTHVNLYSATATQEYCYRVSGSTTNGSLTLQGNYKMRLLLAGCDITSLMGSAIDIEVGKRVAVVLQDGTQNTLTDAPFGSQKAAMYFSGHPEFQGGGTLIVDGRAKHAISAKEYLELKDDLGEIRVVGAVSDGIHCGKGKAGNANNYFEMKGGTVYVENVGSDCIDADDYGCVKLKGGVLNLQVDAQEGSGIKCDSLFSIKNDTKLNINIQGAEAEGIRCNYEASFEGGQVVINNGGDGAKGIKLKRKTLAEDPATTVADGGRASFCGTAVWLYLTGNNSANGDRCMAVSVDHDMSLSAGYINIERSSPQCKSYNVKGSLEVSGTGRLMESGDIFGNEASFNYQNDMVIYAYAQLQGEDITDFANLQIGVIDDTTGEVLGDANVITVASNRCYLELRAYSDSSRQLRFRLYDASTGLYRNSSTIATFVPDAIVGTPSAPTLIEFGKMPGDIDGDHLRTLADLTRLIEVLKARVSDPNVGSLPVGMEHYIVEAADVDGNGTIDMQDIDALLQIIMTNESK